MSKFCGHCGTSLADNATFCPSCGAPVDNQGMPQQQFNQPQQFGQPAFQQAGAMGAPKAGMSKNAKLAIIIAAGVVVVGLIVWLIIALLGGGYEKPVKNYIKALEKQDYDLYCEALTPEGSGLAALASSKPSASSFQNKVKNMISKYGEDYKISYTVVEKEKMDSSQTLNLVDGGYKLKLEFTIKGSKKEATVTKNVTVLKSEGKWYLTSAISL